VTRADHPPDFQCIFVEQPAAVSSATPTTKSGIVLIMELFAVEIALCRVWIAR